MLETLDFTIRIGITPTFLYLDIDRSTQRLPRILWSRDYQNLVVMKTPE